MFGNRNHRSSTQETIRDERYRSLVSSLSIELERADLQSLSANRWTHVGGNLLRIPPVKKKFVVVNKLNAGGGDHGIHSVAISPKGRSVVLGMDSGEVQLRKLTSTMQIDSSLCLRKPVHSNALTAVSCIRFLPTMENTFCCSDLSGRINIFDSEKICKHLLTKENNQINSIDINSPATCLVSGGKDAVLRVYDILTGKILVSTVPLLQRNLDSDARKYHQTRIYCVKFHPENYNIIFSGGLDEYVKMWDMRKGLSVIRTWNGPYIRGDALDVCGNVLLTGSWKPSKSIDLWDISTNNHIETVVPTNRGATLDAEFYESVKFFKGVKDGSVIVAGGSGSGKLDVLNVKDRRIDFATKVGSILKSIDSTTSTIVCGGLDGICRLVKHIKVDERE